MQKTKLAILDMYDGFPNQGMRCIQQIVRQFEDDLDWKVFNVRGAAELPDLTYDIYISTGGPGDPREGDGHWDKAYYRWLDEIWHFNATQIRKKHVLFICHSFQMAVNHFGLGEIHPRKSMSFGTYPVHREEAGYREPLFEGLPSPFWVSDFRRFQVIQPDDDRLERIGAEVLILEKIRPHIDLERAVMGVRFSPEIVGLQFHPEADPDGMLEHFRRPEIKEEVIDEHGEEKWARMMRDLRDPDKIALTHQTIIPRFITYALAALRRHAVAA